MAKNQLKSYSICVVNVTTPKMYKNVNVEENCKKISK